MAQAFNTIQQTINPAKGMYALIPNIPHGHDYIFYSAEAEDTIAAGDFVKLSTSSTNPNDPVVEKAGAEDAVFGMVVYNPRIDAYRVGDKLAVAESGNQVWLSAHDAITAGAQVYNDPDNKAVASSGTTVIGTALTPAAAGGLFKVQLNFTAAAAASSVDLSDYIKTAKLTEEIAKCADTNLSNITEAGKGVIKTNAGAGA